MAANNYPEFRSRHKSPFPQRLAVGHQAMIATAHSLATEAGVWILKNGGNAMDAAVTAAFALGVVEPAASGLGGQTMMIIHDQGSKKKIALDGSSRAPHRIVPGQLNKEALLRGHQATTVPSTPAVLAYALQRYGTKSLAEVLQPAISLARQGYEVSALQAFLLKRESHKMQQHSSAPFFLKKGRLAYQQGEHFSQPVLAKTLERLANFGVEDFYHGRIAEEIAKDMKANNGLIQLDDLAQIPWPVERRPLATHYDPWRLITFGPPGSGRILIEAMNILSFFSKAKRSPDHPKQALLLANIIRRINYDRADRPADPALFPQELDLGEDIAHLPYAKKIARQLFKRIVSSGDTTHLSAMDQTGMTVGLTQSIERVFGSYEASPKLGFLYNNYMSAYNYDDIAHPYYLRPNASPWASVAPSIVFKGRSPWLVLGSPGSERIVSAMIQVLLQLEHGRSPLEAVTAPRLHCSIKNRVSLEASRMSSDLPELLQHHGFEVDERDPFSFYLGCVQMVMRKRNGHYIGVADPRRDGSAGGL